MRGRSSNAKARLRSAGYKCNLCGRRLIDAATLERHQKTIHNVSPRESKVHFKPKPLVQRSRLNKEKEKIISNLSKEQVVDQSKSKLKNSKNNNENLLDAANKGLDDEAKITNKNTDHVENGEDVVEKDDKRKKKVRKDLAKQIQFECPVCAKSFSAYFNAHKHIQKSHSLDSSRKKLRPVRVEQCYRCDDRIRSDTEHTCPRNVEEQISVISEFVCSGCNQNFVSLKSFDLHVASLHSDSVDSMFFPSRLEYMTWRMQMEQQTSAKYSLYGEYESKKIYRCNYARNDTMLDKYTAYFCPSSIVVQEFTKGIQVHFYNKHYEHTANPYTLSSKYKKYSITSFLRSPNEENSVTSAAFSVQLDHKELFSQFKILMDSIIINSAEVEMSILKNLIEKALEMSTIVTEAAVTEPSLLRPVKIMSDKEITDALEMKTDVHKRRRSVDSYEIPPKPAKRMRNKSLFNQSCTELSPKIVNTFSLAFNENEKFDSNGDHIDIDPITSDNTDKGKSVENKVTESDTTTNKYIKMNTRLSSLSESLSFNDSYKDFIDKNFIGKDGKTETKSGKTTVKTKLGAFKQTSPRKTEKKDDTTEMPVINRGIKPISTNKPKIDEASPSKNIMNIETSKINVLNIETPNVTITKVSSAKTESPEVTNSQPSNPKVTKMKDISQLIDPLQVNITKVKSRDSSSPIESQGNSKGISQNTSSLIDPLELNITKVKRNVKSLVSGPRNTSRSYSSPLIDPLKVKAAIENISKDTKFQTSKIESVQNIPKVYSGPGNPKTSPVMRTIKVTPKVSFDTAASHSSAKLTPQKKIKELKYEVREQENDCNILVLKF